MQQLLPIIGNMAAICAFALAARPDRQTLRLGYRNEQMGASVQAVHLELAREMSALQNICNEIHQRKTPPERGLIARNGGFRLRHFRTERRQH